jgi:hypothetical protein
MKYLLLLALAVACLAACLPGEDLVDSLPFFNPLSGELPCIYSGLVKFPEEAGSEMYYMMVRSKIEEKSPVVFWLGGGPGSSSLGGMFLETGPLRINRNENAEFVVDFID